jgi:hypothetical protein
MSGKSKPKSKAARNNAAKQLVARTAAQGRRQRKASRRGQPRVALPRVHPALKQQALAMIDPYKYTPPILGHPVGHRVQKIAAQFQAPITANADGTLSVALNPWAQAAAGASRNGWFCWSSSAFAAGFTGSSGANPQVTRLAAAASRYRVTGAAMKITSLNALTAAPSTVKGGVIPYVAAVSTESTSANSLREGQDTAICSPGSSGFCYWRPIDDNFTEFRDMASSLTAVAGDPMIVASISGPASAVYYFNCVVHYEYIEAGSSQDSGYTGVSRDEMFGTFKAGASSHNLDVSTAIGAIATAISSPVHTDTEHNNLLNSFENVQADKAHRLVPLLGAVGGIFKFMLRHLETLAD